MNINENVINRITDEQKKKAEAARSPEELLSIAKESGYELTLDDINKVSGGAAGCPFCMHENCPQQEPEPSSW